MSEMITTHDRRIDQAMRRPERPPLKSFTQMVTSHDLRIVKMVEKKVREEECRKNWAELIQKGFGGVPGEFPYMSVEDRLFSDVFEDGAWKGQRCFIVGGGESLKDFDFSKLSGELVIGVNRAYEKVDCTIMFALDYKLYNWIVEGKLGQEAKEKFNNFKGHKVWVDSAKYPYPKDIFISERHLSFGLCGK